MKQTAHRRATASFTLIEMLTVIAIIAVMLVIGIPSIIGLSKSTGLSTGTRQVATTLSLARQMAITLRTPVRVVFPMSLTLAQTGAVFTTVPVSMRYQSYAVMTNDRSTGAWGYYGNWEYLPSGVFFQSGADGGSLDNLANLPQWNIMSFPTNCLTSTNNTTTISYMEFRPSGSGRFGNLQNGGSLTIVQGYYPQVNGGVTNFAKVVQTGTANWSTISVDTLLGMPLVSRP